MKAKGWPDGPFARGVAESPVFFPQNAADSQAEVQEVVYHSPQHYQQSRSRWWLAGIRPHIGWLKGVSLPGVQRVLKRLGIVYKRGRDYVHSPDPDYAAKLAQIAQAKAQARADPQHVILVYEDELSYYRQPTLAQGYAVAGSKDPVAVRSYPRNAYQRIAGALNFLTGAVFYWRRAHFDRFNFLNFLLALESAYPAAQVIYVVLDNWPVHFHPHVLQGLDGHTLQLLRLPTYAPWTNPIEKLWRKLYQDLLHLHSHSDDWEHLKSLVAAFLDQFASGSPELLTYVGLAD